MEMNIFEEYDNWWQNELATYHQRGFWDKVRINEKRGTNIKDISIIIGKSTELIKQYIGKFYERINSVTQIITETIDFSNDDDVFLKDLTFILKLYKGSMNTKISASYNFAQYLFENSYLTSEPVVYPTYG